MTCPQCDRLVRENRELRDEVAEWRRLDAASPEREPDHLYALKKTLGLMPGHARVLLALAARAPRCVTIDELFEASRPPYGGWAQPGSKLLQVQICGLRRALAEHGYHDAICAYLGQGYGLSVECAGFVKSSLRMALAA